MAEHSVKVHALHAITKRISTQTLNNHLIPFVIFALGRPARTTGVRTVLGGGWTVAGENLEISMMRLTRVCMLYFFCRCRSMALSTAHVTLTARNASPVQIQNFLVRLVVSC